MFNRFLKYKKFHELIDFENLETKISFVFIILTIIFFESLGIYKNISSYIEAFKNITIYIATALIGLLGVILAGISIVISSLNKNNMKKIEEINGDGTIEKILSSFEFLAFMIGIQVISFFIIYISLFSGIVINTKLLFYILLIIVVYIFIFSIFYTISLVGNCIQFFLISKLYDDINEMEKSKVEILNEIKIDFLLEVLCENKHISKENIIKSLEIYINKQDINNKEEVLEYFKQFYGIK